MKLIAAIQLQPTPAQAAALLATLRAANAACQAISDRAWATRTFHYSSPCNRGGLRVSFAA